MDILEERVVSDLDNEIKKLIPILQFKDYPIEIKGSGGLKAQRYYSDFDLYSEIHDKPDYNDAYREFYSILKNVLGRRDTYFLEFKVQDNKENKYEWSPDLDFDKDKFVKIYKNIKFAKLGIVVRFDFRFVEISMDYYFRDKEPTNFEKLEDLNNKIKELKEEGKYFKILKRMFNIFAIKKKNDKLLYLTEVFNSELGEKYQKLSNLKTLLELIDNDYTDEETIKKIKINLKDLGEDEDLKKIKPTVNKLEKELNKKAKKIYDNL